MYECMAKIWSQINARMEQMEGGWKDNCDSNSLAIFQCIRGFIVKVLTKSSHAGCLCQFVIFFQTNLK